MVETTQPPQVDTAVSMMRGLVGALEPDDVALPEVPGMWRGFDLIERFAGAAKLALARRVDESPVWQTDGCRSAAEYMGRASGQSVRGAREALRASKRLGDVPVVAEALRRGDLSVTQAEMITDAASKDPAKQTALLDAAGRLSLVELAEECARVKAAADPDPDETYRRIRDGRRLRQRRDGEGAWCLSARGTPDDGALFQFVLEPLIDEVFDQARQQGRHEHRDAYAYDALVELLRRHLRPHNADSDDPDRDDDNDDTEHDDADQVRQDGEGTGTTGRDSVEHRSPSAKAAGQSDHYRGTDAGSHGADRGDADDDQTRTAETPTPAPSGPSNQPGVPRKRRTRKRRRKRSRSNPRYMALLHLHVEALQRGKALDGERCEIAGIGPVPVSVARSLLGDAVLKLVLTKGVEVRNVTHLGRGATVAQRVALLWQSPSCSNQACGHRLVQIDHREPWADTRTTRLGCLDPLCPHCHRLKTYQGWELVDGVGPRAFVPPDDPRHPRAKHKAA